MAEKRMFAKSIVLSDAFLDMPMSARCLYFTLNMFADDDGFVGSPKGIMRQCGASEDDMKILLLKKYVLEFDSGIIVIKHWRINNYLRGDRYKETTYTEEKSLLFYDEKGAYTERETDKPVVGIPVGIPSMGTPRIDKNRLDKNSIDKISIDEVNGTTTTNNINEILLSIKSKWNSLPNVKPINDIVPCTSRYTEVMVCIEMFGFDTVLEAIEHVGEAAYLKTRKNVAFDNYINRNVIQKILEGNYDVDFNHEETFAERLARM